MFDQGPQASQTQTITTAPQGGNKKRWIIPVIVLAITLLGVGAGVFLTQQGKDIVPSGATGICQHDECSPNDAPTCQTNGAGNTGYQCTCTAILQPDLRDCIYGVYVWSCGNYNPSACQPASATNPPGQECSPGQVDTGSCGGSCASNQRPIKVCQSNGTWGLTQCTSDSSCTTQATNPPGATNPPAGGCTGGGNTPMTCTGPGTFEVQTCNCPNNSGTSYPGCICNDNCSTQNVTLASGQSQTFNVSAPVCGAAQVDVNNYGGACAGSGAVCTAPPDATTSSSASPTATPTDQISARCINIMAYDTNWSALSAEELSEIGPGDTIRFVVAGNTSSGSFTKARFTINGVLRQEVSQKRPGTEEFYDEYTIPADATGLTVDAQIYHTVLGWF